MMMITETQIIESENGDRAVVAKTQYADGSGRLYVLTVPVVKSGARVTVYRKSGDKLLDEPVENFREFSFDAISRKASQLEKPTK